MKHLFVALLALCVAGGLCAQDGKSIQQLQRDEDFDRAEAAIKNLELATQNLSRARVLACNKAFGSATFCACLNRSLPVAWDFSSYVQIITGTKEANGYAKLDKELKTAYDKVPAIRDACVAEMNQKK